MNKAREEKEILKLLYNLNAIKLMKPFQIRLNTYKRMYRIL